MCSLLLSSRHYNRRYNCAFVRLHWKRSSFPIQDSHFGEVKDCSTPLCRLQAPELLLRWPVLPPFPPICSFSCLARPTLVSVRLSWTRNILIFAYHSYEEDKIWPLPCIRTIANGALLDALLASPIRFPPTRLLSLSKPPLGRNAHWYSQERWKEQWRRACKLNSLIYISFAQFVSLFSLRFV